MELLDEWVVMFETIEENVHVGEAGVAVELESLPGEVEFGFDDFFIAVAADFPPETTDIDEFAVDDRHFGDELAFVMYDLSFPYNSDTIITLFAFEFDPEFELFFFFGVKEVHQEFGAVALNVEEYFLEHEVGAVLHEQGVDGDFVVEVLVLGLFVLVEV